MRYDALLLLAAILMVSGCSGVEQATTDYTHEHEVAVEANNSEQVMEASSVLETRLETRNIPAKVSINNSSDGWILRVKTEAQSPKDHISIIKSAIDRNRINATYSVYVEDETYFNISDSHFLNNTGESVKVDSEEYREGERGKIEDTTFVVRRTGETSKIELLIYDKSDIMDVLSSQKSISSSQSGFSARVPIIISEKAAERMMLMSRNYGGEEYLKHSNGTKMKMRLNMGGETRNLNVASTFRQQKIRQPSITTGAETEGEARRKISVYETSITSGKMPVETELVSSELIEN